MRLILLPGLDGTGILFRPLLQALPPELQPTVVAYPGRQPLGYDDLLPLAHQALPKNEPFVLLGKSFSGPIAIRLAAEHPPGLKALALCGSFITCPVKHAPRWSAPLVHGLPFRFFPSLPKLKNRLGMYSSKQHFGLSTEALSQVAGNVIARRIQEIIRVNVEKELRECNVPILYMQGMHDSVVKPHNLQRVQNIKPEVQVARIDSGHMILKTRPVESVKAITSFVQSLSLDESVQNSDFCYLAN
jgi:pimeloyl-[acyl-carrier protein] methyl ester esterase